MSINVQDDLVDSCSSSCSTQKKVAPSHDVFISFRGEDTRKGFKSHLDDALGRIGVKVFKDIELKRGEEISYSLVKAIEESRLSIIVFSKHYATSTWCLEELVHIMHYRNSKGQMVRPVFVDVDPSEVRKQTREFGEALASHEKNDKIRGKVQGWRAALKEAANLSGWHLQNEIESDFIRRIVEEIHSKLNRPILHIAEYPVGLDSQVQAINSLLDIGSNDTLILGIYGVGGLGKTTIAKAVYNMVADRFEGSCFLARVGEMSKKNRICWLQQTLLYEVVGEKGLNIAYNFMGRDLIKAKLSHKKVLVVLDGVDRFDDVDELAGGKDWFGIGSRIIITTRESLPLDRVDVSYRAKELEPVDALQLFSWNAFKKPHPPGGQYTLLSDQFASLAKGIPLTLIVLGSFLFNKTTKEWFDAREKLLDVPSENINHVVKISFDGLGENEGSIFLDIACFFQGDDIDDVIKQFHRCNFHPESGIEKLLNMSLIYIEFNKVWMHEIIQQFGMDIVVQESPADPRKRSRLWHHHDIQQVLKQDSVNYAVQGMKLDWPGAENELSRNNAIEKFKCLRLLIVRDAYFTGCPEYLSKNLQWLRWRSLSTPRPMESHHDADFSRRSTHSDFKDTSNIKSHLRCFQGIVPKIAMGNPVQLLGGQIKCFQGETNFNCLAVVSKTARKPVQHIVGSLGGQMGCFAGEINLKCFTIVSEAARKPVQQIVGLLFGQMECFHGKTNLKRLPIVTKKAARKLMQLLAVVGPLGSQIKSMHKRCFVMRKQIRERRYFWELHNDAKLCREFSFFQIQCATNNFNPNNLIREGGYSQVYLAEFDSRRAVAVKRIRSDREHSYECMLNELKIQGRLHHKSILPLLGYFIDNKEVILVLEYMSNGTLRDHLDGYGSSTHFLSWSNRIKVALDIARGIEYLHVFVDPPIIHRDIKTSNILLDHNYTTKLADFGISMEAEWPVYEDTVKGTYGYVCPHYLRTNEVTTKCDVYGFGVVLLELLTGQKPYIMDDSGRHCTLVDKELGCLEQIGFLDERMPLTEGLEMEATMLVHELARECLICDCGKRPSMTQVVRRLEGVLEKWQPREENTGSECSLLTDSRVFLPYSVQTSSHSTELDSLELLI